MDALSDTARLEALVARVQQKRTDGEALSEMERRTLEALEAANAAEAGARESFAAFYRSLSGGEGVDQSALPPEVALQMGRWVEARRAWDTVAAELLALPPPPVVRRGPRLRTRSPEAVHLPANLPARDLLAALFAPHLWKTDAAGEGLMAQLPSAQVRVEFDAVLGFGPERAIQQVAKYGASAAQTFLSLLALWREQNVGQPHETYLTLYASDLLRFQGRKETPHGGYHRDDLLAKGRDIYFLSRVSLPRAETLVQDGGQRTVRTLSIGRLLSLESLEAITEEGPDAVQSVVRFRYHPGKEVHAWVAGDDPQFAIVSSKLLGYHPNRQKYQILLGFCLAHADWFHRGEGEAPHRIPLLTLLDLASVPVPERRIAAFLASVEDALNELARDGVLPGLHLQKPEGWTELLAARRTREVIAGSVVVFPRLRRALPA